MAQAGSLPSSSPNADFRRAALLSLVLVGGAAAALALANYLSKNPRVAVSTGSDSASLDDWLRKAAKSMETIRQRIVENVDSSPPSTS